VSTLLQDLRLATRVLSLVDSLFLGPLVPDPPAERVNIFTARKEANRDYRRFSYAEFSALREANPVFRDAAARSFTFVLIGRACGLPARRAAGVDLAVALRCE
jgi:hypothetical protein